MRKNHSAFGIGFCSVILCLFFSGTAFSSDGAVYLFKSCCQSCHGADGAHAPAAGIALIKGQSRVALAKILAGYQEGLLGGRHKHAMQGVTRRLSPEDITVLARYVSRL